MTQYITERQNYLLEQYLTGQLSPEEHQELENALNDSQNEHLLVFIHAFNEHHRRVAYKRRLEIIKKQEVLNESKFKLSNFFSYFQYSSDFFKNGTAALKVLIQEYYLIGGIATVWAGSSIYSKYATKRIPIQITVPTAPIGNKQYDSTLLCRNKELEIKEASIRQLKKEVILQVDSMFYNSLALDTYPIQNQQLKIIRNQLNKAIRQGETTDIISFYQPIIDLKAEVRSVVDQYILALCYIKMELNYEAISILETFKFQTLPLLIKQREIDRLLNQLKKIP
jgi:hypothetical protein